MNTLEGMGVSPGIATGKVKIIKNKNDFSKFQEGDVLVTHITEPSMTILMNKASAIVCDIGGMNSHPSIVSREMGKPCVVNTKISTKDLTDGILVKVDGERGTVKIIGDWLDEFIDSFIKCFSIMDARTFRPFPVSATSIYAKFYVNKVLNAVKEAKDSSMPLKQIAKLFPSPNALRIETIFLLIELKYAKASKKDSLKILNYLNKLLKELAYDDVYCREKNIAHSSERVKGIIESIKWSKVNPKQAAELGKLSNSCSSLCWSIYTDYFYFAGFDVYGPYDVSKYFGKNTILVIRDYFHLKPTSIWWNIRTLPYNSVRIFYIYRDLGFKVDMCVHTYYDSNPVDKLLYYRVLVNDKPINSIKKIKKVAEEIAKFASKHYLFYEKLSFEDKKRMLVKQRYYQVRNFLKTFDENPEPSKELIKYIKGKKIPKDPFEVKEGENRDEVWKRALDPRNEFYPKGF